MGAPPIAGWISAPKLHWFFLSEFNYYYFFGIYISLLELHSLRLIR